MKTKITELAIRWNVDVSALLELKSKLNPDHCSGAGKNTWFTEEAVDLLEIALDVPELLPDKTYGVVARNAANPNYCYVKLHDKDSVVPVCIPRKYSGKLVGKKINVEIITDINGSSYRYCK
jgi:hypothetical protein